MPHIEHSPSFHVVFNFPSVSLYFLMVYHLIFIPPPKTQDQILVSVLAILTEGFHNFASARFPVLLIYLRAQCVDLHYLTQVCVCVERPPSGNLHYVKHNRLVILAVPCRAICLLCSATKNSRCYCLLITNLDIRPSTVQVHPDICNL